MPVVDVGCTLRTAYVEIDFNLDTILRVKGVPFLVKKAQIINFKTTDQRR